MKTRYLVYPLVLIAALVFGVVAFAQDGDTTDDATPAEEAPTEEATPVEEEAVEGEAVVEEAAEVLEVTGLNNPRNISFAPDGTLYIAEGGTGGELSIDTPEGPGTFGMTSSISAVAPDASLSVLVDYLPSSDGSGAHGVYATDTTVWVTLSGGPPFTPLTSAVLVLDRASGRIVGYIDVLAAETAQNPDGNEIDSNPVNIEVGPDGTIYIVDSGCNCIWKVGEGLTLSPAAAWPDNPVPTGVAAADDGSLWVSFLSPFPFTPGSAHIEHWANGELVGSWDGFNMLTDIEVGADGAVYVVSLTQGLGQTGFTPNSGGVWRVENGEATAVADGLNFPYGLAQAPDGTWYVSTNSSFVAPGTGAVVAVP